ncbi:MAG: hypothetical protein IJX77_10200 [Ruminococcus sp.]|nr:hypothetical protein [Ruminococcus sp.]
MKDTEALERLIHIVVRECSAADEFELMRWLFHEYEMADMVETPKRGDIENVH